MTVGSWELAPALVERLKAEYEALKSKGKGAARIQRLCGPLMQAVDFSAA